MVMRAPLFLLVILLDINTAISEETWILDYPAESAKLLSGLKALVVPAFKENGIALELRPLPNARGLKALHDERFDGSLFRHELDAEKYAENYSLIQPYLVLLEFVFIESMKTNTPKTITNKIVTPRDTITTLNNYEEYGSFFYAHNTTSAIKLVASKRYEKALVVKQISLPLTRIYGRDVVYHDPPVAVVRMGMLLHKKHQRHYSSITQSLIANMNNLNLR